MCRLGVILLFSMLLIGCGRQTLPTIQRVEVVQSEGVDDGWPSRIWLRVEVENPSARVALLRARARISYAERRVAMLSLEDKVVVPARSRSIIELPLHLAVQRNSQTLAFREALRTHNAEKISIDWQLAVRSRMVYIEQEQEPKPIAEVLSAEQQSWLWELIEE